MGLHEMKCPACGAPLKFDPAAGNVECEYCGTHFEVEQLLPKKESSSQTRMREAEEKASREQRLEKGETEFNWGNYKSNLDLQQMEDARCYICKSCGAELVTTSTTAATKCPYCDNEIVLDERVTGAIKPNGIVPFKISVDQLPDILKGFYNKKPLLPRNFFNDNKIKETQGVYVPFWLFSGTMDGDVQMEGRKIHAYKTGAYDVTETSFFTLIRRGELSFAHVPVNAHSKVAAEIMEALEPYDFSEIKEYEDLYMAGFVADRFDEDPDLCIPRAEQRMKFSEEIEFKRTAREYSLLQVMNGHFDLKDPSVKYVLLPAYFITCEFGGRTYTYAINGQTGKIVGELPIDKSKRFRNALACGLGLAAVVGGLFLLIL